MRRWRERHAMVPRRRLALLTAVLGAGGCLPGMPPLTPAESAPLTVSGLAPLTPATVAEWVRAFQPHHPMRYEVRWWLRTNRRGSQGRGVVIVAPPDSVRVDYRAPLGRRGAAVLIENEIVWSVPEETIGRLISSPPLFRAALGIPGLPPPTASVSGRTRPEDQVWRYTTGDTTLTYVQTARSSRTLTAQLIVDGRMVGTSFVALSDSTGLPVNGRLRIHESGTLFAFTVEATELLSSVDPDIWKHP